MRNQEKIYSLFCYYLGGCPLASKSKDDLEYMTAQTAGDHPGIM